MTDFNYKKYSLEQLENWLHDALSCDDLTAQEIYETITTIVGENVEYHKKELNKGSELLSLLKGHREVDINDFLKERAYYEGWDVNAGITSLTGPDNNEPIVCDSSDSSPECTKAWEEFWQGHDEPYYTEEEMDAMCERAASEELKKKCIEQNREYNFIKNHGGYDWTP